MPFNLGLLNLLDIIVFVLCSQVYFHSNRFTISNYARAYESVDCTCLFLTSNFTKCIIATKYQLLLMNTCLVLSTEQRKEAAQGTKYKNIHNFTCNCRFSKITATPCFFNTAFIDLIGHWCTAKIINAFGYSFK